MELISFETQLAHYSLYNKAPTNALIVKYLNLRKTKRINNKMKSFTEHISYFFFLNMFSIDYNYVCLLLTCLHHFPRTIAATEFVEKRSVVDHNQVKSSHQVLCNF